MTPKEKAEELVNHYTKELLKAKYKISGFVIEELSIQCALILVNEILKRPTPEQKKYWELVKQEIITL